MSILFRVRSDSFAVNKIIPYTTMKAIKLLFSCTLVFLLSITSYAQTGNVFVYGETGLSLGTHTSGKLALNAIINKSIFSVAYFGSARKSPTVPADFQPFLWDDAQTVSVIALMYGRVIYTQNNAVRYNIKGGIGIGKTMTPMNFVKANHGYLLGSGYDFERHEEQIVGLILNPCVELPFSRGFGFNFGAYANVNLVSPVAGIEATMAFGYLRKVRK